MQHCEYQQKKRPSTVLFTLLTWRIGSLVVRNCGLFTQKLPVTAGWYISYSFCTEGWFDVKVDVSTSSEQQFKNSSHIKTVQSGKEDRIRRKISETFNGEFTNVDMVPKAVYSTCDANSGIHTRSPAATLFLVLLACKMFFLNVFISFLSSP